MNLRIVTRIAMTAALTTAVVGSASAQAASCESLASLTFPDTTVTIARSVAPGALKLGESAVRGGPEAGAGEFDKLPAFCRVAATLKPTSDSDIKIEVWLPIEGWNGKFEAVGNGGWAGFIAYEAMAEAVRRGYATASTDTGHVGNTGSFALGHPEKLIDFAYRAVHEMTLKGKSITSSFYGTGPKFSYWNGCSTGGREGLKEAQFYPNDYDGIIAGDPANPRTHLASWSLMVGLAAHKEPGSYIPPAKYPMVHKAVVDACDGIDGLKDGLIDDPRKCQFDPKVLACKGEDDSACLTSLQVEAMKNMLKPAKNPRSGDEIYPPLELGTELGWAVLAGPQPFGAAVDQFKYVVFKDPNWDWRTFDPSRDVELADKIDNNSINAIDPKIQPFFSHGGKMIMYHGWSDQNVAPRSAINYYESVVKTVGGASKSSDSIRLFMAPGMGHCRGGDGPNTFDVLTALEQWVEKGKAPDQVVASHSTAGKVDRTRPLCPYPQVARYKGNGSIDDAANFTCRMP